MFFSIINDTELHELHNLGISANLGGMKMRICFNREFCKEMNLKIPESTFFWEAKEEYTELDLPESVINKLKKDYEKKTGKTAKTKVP
jgi:hypothetical protein